MPKKQDTPKSAKQAVPKKTPAKKHSSTATQKKTQRSAPRKKRQNKGLIAALVLFCVLLAGFNIFLITKLISTGDISLFSARSRETQTAIAKPPVAEDSAELQAAESPTETPEDMPLPQSHKDAGSISPETPPPLEQPAVQALARSGTAPQEKPAPQKSSALKKPSSAEEHTELPQPAAAAAKQNQPVQPSTPQHTQQTNKSAVQQTGKNTAKHQAQPAAPQKSSKTEHTAAQPKAAAPQTAAGTTATAAPQKKTAAASGTAHTENPAVQNRKPAAPPEKSGTVQDKKNVQPLAKPEQPKKQAPYSGNLIFVFDDAGHNLAQLEHFLRLPFPCTIAVLPGLRYSSESARRIRKAGKQVILHQPMQSVNLHLDPGPGAIVPGLTAEQIKEIVRKNLEEIWPAAGMNNHEGSLITADEYAMKAVLEVVAEKHIFFLDSRTTAKSVAAKVAKEQNMAIWERAIFIDNDKSRIAMEAQIKKGLSIAKRAGSAIMIGHVFTIELAELLTEMYPNLVEEGYSLSAIAEAAQKGKIE